MAKHVTTTRVDDLDDSAPARPVSFAVEGVDYEIDLSAEHAEQLRAALAVYIECARAVERPARPARPECFEALPFVRLGRHQGIAVRRWAIDQGIELPRHGVPMSVWRYYRAWLASDQPVSTSVAG